MILPASQAPAIVYQAPLWRVRINGSRHETEVRASGAVEARFAGARALGCSVAVVIAERVADPKLARFACRA